MRDMLEVYASQLVPPALDRSKVAARKQLVLAVLGRTSMSVSSMNESGSWSHGTGIAQKSDVDYMARCSAPRPVLPSSALASLKSAVSSAGSWEVSNVTTSSPVIQVQFYDGLKFEIAPAWFWSHERGYQTFLIPGRSDEWVVSAPGAHLDYVNQQNDRLGKKVKPLVRLLKAWKHHVDLPVSSFYLEMRAAQHASSQTHIDFEFDLKLVWLGLLAGGLRDMNDPQGIVGRIPSCSSEEKRIRALGQIRRACDSLEQAVAARRSEDVDAYWHHMSSLFGAGFPWPS